MVLRALPAARGAAGHGGRVRRMVAAVSIAGVLSGGLAACSLEDADLADGGGGEEPADVAQVTEEPTPPVRLSVDVAGAKNQVKVHSTVQMRARNGTLRRVKVTSPEGPLAGKLGGQSQSWASQGRLEPGVAYTIRALAVREDGSRQQITKTFRTEDLTLDQQTYPSIAPLDGETVGVGMPVIVSFDIPVSNRAAIERKLRVRSAPKQQGTWHWVSDSEVHWRPQEYWKPGTEVTVDVNINSVKAGPDLWGQENRKVSFEVGERHIYRVNLQQHQMRVLSGGKLLRTLPVTAGKEGFTTRSGTKVIMVKHRTYDMNSGSIGINPSSAEGYDLEDVGYAMRLTHSGEFLHAAPWSVGSQGEANVSHGCTGLSPANAEWLYELSRRGDVVEFTGSDKPMTLHNGWGDWNASFAEYAEGSAL